MVFMPATDSALEIGPRSFRGRMTPIDGIAALRGSRGLGGFVLRDEDARAFIDLIYRESGIVLTPDKKSLISSRLHKRVKSLGLDSFADYLQFLQTARDRDDEIVAMIDEITTNKTAFFREPHHFDYLRSHVLPSLATSDWSVLNIWSAGCSTGEEPYTLAMVLADYFGTTRNFTIIATDLSTQALTTARRAVYANDLGTPIPFGLRQKYTLSGHGRQAGFFRIVPELRERMTFAQVNLIAPEWGIPGQLHLIFCRNVMIYFDRKTRAAIVSRFRKQLRDGGHLFIGHSETLGDVENRFIQKRPTIYAR